VVAWMEAEAWVAVEVAAWVVLAEQEVALVVVAEQAEEAGLVRLFLGSRSQSAAGLLRSPAPRSSPCSSVSSPRKSLEDGRNL